MSAQLAQAIARNVLTTEDAVSVAQALLSVEIPRSAHCRQDISYLYRKSHLLQFTY